MTWERVLLPDSKQSSTFADYLEVFGISVRLTALHERFDAARELPELILVGGSVSVRFAVQVIELAVERWPSLRFAFLSCDEQRYEPEERHYEVYVGAPLTSALMEICLPWSGDDWSRLIREMPLPEFHSYIRNFYSSSRRQHTKVRFVGGPRDGDCASFPGVPASQPKLFFVRDRAGKAVSRYERHDSGEEVAYEFVEMIVEEE